jgi:hypothetical protein
MPQPVNAIAIIVDLSRRRIAKAHRFIVLHEREQLSFITIRKSNKLSLDGFGVGNPPFWRHRRYAERAEGTGLEAAASATVKEFDPVACEFPQVPSVRMGFALRLVQDLVEVEAGSSSPVTVIVVNKTEALDRYELEVEGVDSEWKAIPVPTFTGEPGEEHTERFFVKPPRSSESLAGNYPFVVRVRSLESGEQKTVQGALHLKPYHHLTMEIDPKKGAYSPTVRRNVFDITIVNLGNTDHTLQLVGSDPEDSCTYEFEHEQVTVGPGQQREVTLTAHPVSTPILSTGKLIGFSVAGRSIDTPSIVTTAQAQLEQRSLFSPGTLAIAVVLALIIAVWILMRPKPPAVEVAANPMSVTAGTSATVSWIAHDATRVSISAISPSGQQTDIYDGNELSGSESLPMTDPGKVTIIANVYHDSVQGSSDRKTINVVAPIPVVPPTITSFSGSGHSFHTGGSITFKWDVDNAVKVSLPPLETDLDPSLGSINVALKDPGEFDVALVATSKDGGTTKSKVWKVNVVDVSDAHILSFTATPSEVDPGGTAIISWQVTNAARVELKPQTGAGGGPVDLTGSQAFQLTAKTAFSLIATDAQGRTTSKRIFVNVQIPKPPPPTVNPATGDTTGETTGISTGTTPPPTSSTTGGNPTNPDTAGTTGGRR